MSLKDGSACEQVALKDSVLSSLSLSGILVPFHMVRCGILLRFPTGQPAGTTVSWCPAGVLLDFGKWVLGRRES